MRQFFPNAWYADALPSGAYCVLTPRVGIDTHLGRLPLPVGEAFGPLYLRCTDVGGFRFAGQAHDGTNPAAYEWRQGAGWRALPPPCCGQSPLIYDRLGVLHLSDCSIGSQGWRYVENDGTATGHLVTGDATYGPFKGLSEYAALGDGLWIGQGHDFGGVLVFDGIALRLLEGGDGRFIRANRDGERVAIAFMKSEGVVIYQTTMTELRALPQVGEVAPPIRPPVKPLPSQPEPEPVPVPMPLPTAVPFDIHQVMFVDNPPDLASWAETATITSIDLSTGRICVDHNKRSGPNAWPDAPFGDGGTGTCQYTLGLCLQIGGKWYGSAVIQFWQGRDLAAGGDVDRIAKDWYYSDRWAPLTGHQPAKGELVGWFVAAGNLRDNTRIGVRERSNVVVIPFGQNYSAGGPVPVPVPPVPVPPPTPTPDPTPAPAGPTYADVVALVPQLDAAYQLAQPGRKKHPLDPGTTAFFIWRYLREGYSAADLIADATARGKA